MNAGGTGIPVVTKHNGNAGYLTVESGRGEESVETLDFGKGGALLKGQSKRLEEERRSDSIEAFGAYGKILEWWCVIRVEVGRRKVCWFVKEGDDEQE